MTASPLHAALQPRRLRVLLLASACNVAIWILAGVFATSEFYRRSIVMGGVGLLLARPVGTAPGLDLACSSPLRVPHGCDEGRRPRSRWDNSEMSPAYAKHCRTGII